VTMQHDPGAASAAMRQVAQTGRSALQEMRQLLGLLRAEGDASITSPQPGLEQLEELAAELRSTGLTVRTTVEGQPQPLPATAQLTAYRAVQEAFTNTLKHGHQVTLVVVRLRWTSTRLGLQVTDDGQPCRLDPRVTVPGGGMGLVGMRERVAAAGGAMTAAPRSGQGRCVDVELPLCDDGTA